MERNKILLMGVGNQGQKIINAVDRVCNGYLRKVYVDKEKPEMNLKGGAFIQIPFHLELGAWEPEYPIKLWMSYEETMLENMFREVKLLVIACGVGGEQTIVAKEMMKYCQKSHPEIAIYFVGNLPFKRQTDYSINYVTRLMIDSLRILHVAYTVIDSNCLERYYEEFQMAYDLSHYYLAMVIEGVLSMVYPKRTYTDESIVKLPRNFWKEPIYYMEFDVDRRNITLPILSNPFLPLEFVKDSGMVEIQLQSRLDNQQVKSILSLHDDIEEQLGEIECLYYEGKEKENDSFTWRVKILGNGKEGKRRMRCQEINVYPIF